MKTMSWKTSLARVGLLRFPRMVASTANLYGRLRNLAESSALRIMAENLSAAYPEKSPLEILELARTCVRTIRMDEIYQYRLQLLERAELIREIRAIELVGIQYRDGAYATGRPVIIVTAHYGAFMLGALKAALEFPERRMNFFYNPTARNAYAATSDTLLNLISAECGILHSTPKGVLAALKCLKRGEGLCIVADQIVPEGSITFVPFFGRFYGTMTGVAYFARATNALVLPAFCRSTAPGRASLQFDQPIDAADFSGRNPSETVYRITCAMFASFERTIREVPQHWRYWPTFKKLSLDRPLPPKSQDRLGAQLKEIRLLIAHDTSLAGKAEFWAQAESALGSVSA